MPALPNPQSTHPVTLPDGTAHPGTVFLAAVIDQPNFTVGDFTYASRHTPPDDPAQWAQILAPYHYPMSTGHLSIGRFGQIAHGVEIITAGANHTMGGPSTFPFDIFDMPNHLPDQPDGRDTVIGHDVWIGTGARILPGARIGNGVIVGAGAHVGGVVPDYAVVTGNPARIHRFRYSPEQIALLLDLAWWHWPEDRIAAAARTLQHGTPEDLAALKP